MIGDFETTDYSFEDEDLPSTLESDWRLQRSGLPDVHET
jgi:hypothetical protein